MYIGCRYWMSWWVKVSMLWAFLFICCWLLVFMFSRVFPCWSAHWVVCFIICWDCWFVVWVCSWVWFRVRR